MPEKINSSNALVAYLDLLGYSELVRKNPTDALFYHDAIEQMTSIVKEFFKVKNIEDTEMIRIMGPHIQIMDEHLSFNVLSDSFVIVFDQNGAREGKNYETTTPEAILESFLFFVSYLIQDGFCKTKMLFRGAIARGHYYQQGFQTLEKSNFIFSGALCDAHDLAEKIADVPRVLIHPGVLEESFIFNPPGRFIDSSFHVSPFVKFMRDKDGLYFLNGYTSIFGDRQKAFDILSKSASILRNGLESHKNDLKVKRKWIWFANYHNEILERAIRVKYFVLEDWQRLLLMVAIPKA